MKLPSEQIHALMAHEGKYRKRIEQESRVHLALEGTDGFRIIGGPKAVKSAERSVTDLFRSEECGDDMRDREQSICSESIPT